MITGVSHNDATEVPDSHSTSTKAPTAKASLTCVLLLTITFSIESTGTPLPTKLDCVYQLIVP